MSLRIQILDTKRDLTDLVLKTRHPETTHTEMGYCNKQKISLEDKCHPDVSDYYIG